MGAKGWAAAANKKEVDARLQCLGWTGVHRASGLLLPLALSALSLRGIECNEVASFPKQWQGLCGHRVLGAERWVWQGLRARSLRAHLEGALNSLDASRLFPFKF